jgi:hypothetical protein
MGSDFMDGIKPFLYNGLAILRYIPDFTRPVFLQNAAAVTKGIVRS